MHIDSHYPVRHRLPPGRSRSVPSLLQSGSRAIAAPTEGETIPIYSLNYARSGSDKLTASTSPLRGRSRCSEPCYFARLTLRHFHEVSRAADPNGQTWRTFLRQPSEDTGFGGLLRRADDPVPDPVRVSGASTRAGASCTSQSPHILRQSGRRSRCAKPSRGYGTTVFAAGSRSHLWPRL